MRARRARLVTGVAVVVAALVAYRSGRTAQLAWGATDSERRAALPGDDLTPDADLVATRAVTVEAPAGAVWPWLVQMGQGRGGFYSYDALENLAGCDIHSAETVVPEWQDLAVGDEVRLHPRTGLPVAVLDPGHALVLHGAGPTDEDDADDDVPVDFTWALVLQPVDEGRTRLVVRERYAYRTPWAGRLVEPLSWASFVMTQRMLRGIRDRAERAHLAAA